MRAPAGGAAQALSGLRHGNQFAAAARQDARLLHFRKPHALADQRAPLLHPRCGFCCTFILINTSRAHPLADIRAAAPRTPLTSTQISTFGHGFDQESGRNGVGQRVSTQTAGPDADDLLLAEQAGATGMDVGSEGSAEAPPQGLVSAEAEERLQETPELDYLTHIVMRLFENKRWVPRNDDCCAASL